MHRIIAVGVLAVSLGLHVPLANGDESPEADPAGFEFFEKNIRPVLVAQCYECHSHAADEVKGGLLLDSREGIRTGGDSGPAVVVNDAASSLLLDALKYDGFEMPPERRLSDDVVSNFRKWIEMGAPDPRDAKAPTVSAEKGIDWEAAAKFWAFQRPSRYPQPNVRRANWVRRPIDAFILGRLEQAGLEPNDAADRRVLIRRVTFDLTGLPPTPRDVESFVNDPQPGAYERVVERLLNSPQYGERWARMWLDIARYAEDQAHVVGNNKSLFYPNAYRFRDWVVTALNDDMPYDEFIRRQLAADLLDSTAEIDLAALGFIGLGPKYYRRNSPEVMADEWENQVDTVTRGLLGLTVACARCHDHKYDPIPTEDYYALAGVFASVEMFNRPMDAETESDKNGQAKKPEESLHIVRDKAPVDLNVMIRGDVKNKGPLAERGFLRILCEDSPVRFTRGSGRLELAEQIASEQNPLTARVYVNRVWARYFGQPLVGTPSNFGQLGQPPTHPHLLDDLAVRFMENGWSRKWLHREIVLSSAYAQSSHIDPAKQAVDPANTLLWRMNRKRLDVEAWRDAVLTVAGRIDLTIGGRSIDPDQPNAVRRTLYSRVSRLELNKMLALFDFPDPNAHSARRVETTTALQKLFVMNSPFMVENAKALAARLTSAPAEAEDSRVRAAYELLFGRSASGAEVDLAVEFLTGAGEHGWAQYAQTLLASNEMLVLD